MYTFVFEFYTFNLHHPFNQESIKSTKKSVKSPASKMYILQKKCIKKI